MKRTTFLKSLLLAPLVFLGLKAPAEPSRTVPEDMEKFWQWVLNLRQEPGIRTDPSLAGFLTHAELEADERRLFELIWSRNCRCLVEKQAYLVKGEVFSWVHNVAFPDGGYRAAQNRILDIDQHTNIIHTLLSRFEEWSRAVPQFPCWREYLVENITKPAIRRCRDKGLYLPEHGTLGEPLLVLRKSDYKWIREAVLAENPSAAIGHSAKPQLFGYRVKEVGDQFESCLVTRDAVYAGKRASFNIHGPNEWQAPVYIL